MNTLSERDFATRVHQKSFAILNGTLPEKVRKADHHVAMKVGTTEVCLCEIIGLEATREATELALSSGGVVKIAPCRNNRVIVCVMRSETQYILVYDGVAIAGAPSLTVFRPKPPETTHEVYKAPYSKRSDGRFRTH